MRARWVFVTVAGGLLFFLGLNLVGVAAIMIFVVGGSSVLEIAAPYLLGGVIAAIVGGSLVYASVKLGAHRAS